jgi:hypothetical protein
MHPKPLKPDIRRNRVFANRCSIPYFDLSLAAGAKFGKIARISTCIAVPTRVLQIK